MKLAAIRDVLLAAALVVVIANVALLYEHHRWSRSVEARTGKLLDQTGLITPQAARAAQGVEARLTRTVDYLSNKIEVVKSGTSPTPMKSFSYESSSCDVQNQMFLFGTTGIKIGLGPDKALPGAGVFPSGNFWIRKVSITHRSPTNDGWSLVGHSGLNGDWVTGMATPNNPMTVEYPADAAPLFTAGEYFDVHSQCQSSDNVYVTIWYVPAP